MHTARNIDDDLITQASNLTGINNRTALLNAGLKALIERESPKRLAQLGDSEPQVTYTIRRQSTPN